MIYNVFEMIICISMLQVFTPMKKRAWAFEDLAKFCCYSRNRIKKCFFLKLFIYSFFFLLLFFSSSFFMTIERPCGPPKSLGPYYMYRLYRPLLAPAYISCMLYGILRKEKIFSLDYYYLATPAQMIK